MKIKRNQVFRSLKSGNRIRVLAVKASITGDSRQDQVLIKDITDDSNRRLVVADSIRRKYIKV